LQNNTFSGESLRQKLIVLDEIGSTNDYLKSKLSNFKPLPEWTAIMAKNQTMGRGQRQNSWKSEPNSNITFSFVIYPNHLSLQQHFTLNMLVSLGIIDWLKSLQIDSTIKWPNDIMIGNRKISGILIENISNSKEIRQSIIGIGVNVNQKQFSEEFSNRASSILNETGIFTEDLESECLNLLAFIAKRVERHKKNTLTDKDLLIEYNNNLFRRDIPAFYSSGNISFEATLVKVDGNGQLYLRTKEDVKTYYFKEVVFQMQ
jgi:BirA family biotin operon repressor/biotin-[acetyl-CoA-carboxylase] ligase